MTRWGSFAFFGPLTIHPELWNRRIAQKLLAPTIELLDFWGVKQAGLFTFANSVKHIALYQKFGFWPRFLTAILFKPVKSVPFEALVYSHLSADARESALGACRELTDAIFEGLDLTSEISALETEKLGDTVLLGVDDALDAFAICHCGEGTEAGRGNCYLKFAAARDESSFVRLLAACEAFAAERGLENIEAGVNLERSRAYSSLLNAGFRTLMQGVAMMRPDAPGYNRPDVFAIDDWR